MPEFQTNELITDARNSLIFLFNDVFNNLDHIASNVWMNFSNELGKMQNEAVVAQFEGSSKYLREGTEENHKNTVKVTGVPTEIRSNHLPKQKSEALQLK